MMKQREINCLFFTIQKNSNNTLPQLNFSSLKLRLKAWQGMSKIELFLLINATVNKPCVRRRVCSKLSRNRIDVMWLELSKSNVENLDGMVKNRA